MTHAGVGCDEVSVVQDVRFANEPAGHVHASELARPVEAKPALQVQLAGEAGAVPAGDVALPGHGAHRDEARLK